MAMPNTAAMISQSFLIVDCFIVTCILVAPVNVMLAHQRYQLGKVAHPILLAHLVERGAFVGEYLSSQRVKLFRGHG